MAWSSSTWRGAWTTSASDADPLEDALADIVHSAQDDLDSPGKREEDTGELIEGADSITFVLLAPGYSKKDIRTKAEEDRLLVEAYDFKIVKPLRCRVEPSTARSSYVNGVLSVRMDKRI